MEREVILGSKHLLFGMEIKIIVYEAGEGGFWAEVPAIPGCATQGETIDELFKNLHEAIAGCLSGTSS
jgi:predicted RNase H-like HicB family nuclease